MKYILFSGHDLLKDGLKKHDLTLWEEVTERNENTLKAIFRDITGNNKTFYQDAKNNVIIAHRSTRKGVLVQVSVLWKDKSGDLIPASHTDINTERDFILEHPFYNSYSITEVQEATR